MPGAELNTFRSSHSTDLVVRYAETDQMGVVHHSQYAIYFEAARVELMKHLGLPYHEMEKKGFFLPVVDLGVRFLQPIKFGDTIRVRAAIYPVEGVRVRIEYEIKRDDSILASGYTVHAFIGREGRPCRPPSFFVSAIK